WLFIDGQMVIDLGGAMAVGEQFIELDRLGLNDGEVYSFHLFYADRNDFSGVFRLRTNIEVSSDSFLPSVNAVFD
ncbi:MAG: fibro-slime domain-containing protein, partial [Planctomycetota bacterium]